ncbi:MAG: S8 family peptidase [Lachnospiraceae bacterium]|nr:S8 family peptidase [Lachnospiraceae bacterium]
MDIGEEINSCREKILSNDYSDWITDFELTSELINLDTTEGDYCYRQVDDTLGLVFTKRDSMNPIGLLNYSYQQLPSLFGLQQLTTNAINTEFDSSPLVESGITRVQREPLNLSGRGTVLVFIDTGIDYTNPVFRNSDGSSRIIAIWDQTIQSGQPPEGFWYGTQYLREEINRALENENPYTLVPTKDENGHGTAVASIACGSRMSDRTYSGVAYEADILVIKLKECKKYLREYYLLPEDVPAYQSTDIIMALEYADGYARSFVRPVIFCMALGTSYGSHSGTSPLSNYINRLGEKRSRVFVIGGGNEGNAAHHYRGDLSPIGSEAGKMEEIEIRVGDGEKGFLAEIWGKSPNVFSLAIRTPGGEEIPNTGIRIDRGVEYQFVYEKAMITVSYALVEGTTGDELITLRFQNPTPGIWTILLQNESGLKNAPVHLWLPISEFLSAETYLLRPNPEITMTIPAYAQSAITTVTYNSYNNSVYVRSGRGFSRGSEIKPDLAAPGVEISSIFRGLPGEVRVGKVTGAAASTAMMTGAASLFMQWAVPEKNASYLKSSEVKNYFIRGAIREENLTYPNRLWGFGKLSLEGVFDSLAGI